MTHSSLVTKTIPHHNKFHSRGGIAISRVIVHHWASTSGGDTSLADPNRNASVNYFVYSDGTVGVQVPEEYRAWTSGGPAADLPSITIEVQNSSTQVFNNNNGDPRSWAVSDKALAALAALIADIAHRYKWGSVNRTRVRGHREFDATACPGGYLWARLSSIAQAADDLLKNKSANTPEEEDEDMPDSMFAVVDGVPSWCWLNWATGEIFACHTQKEADWIGRYMGSVRNNWSGDPAGSDLYKNKLAMFGILAPKATIQGGGALTAEDLAQVQAHVDAGVKGALAGLTLKADIE